MEPVNPDPKNIPDDDLILNSYQDDLDTDDSFHDPIIDEETDDPTKELGIDPVEFRKELNKYDIDEEGNGDDDMREAIEDEDELTSDDTSY